MVWWQARQLERLHQVTELIREQTLQDLFALRRSLGVAIAAPTGATQLEPTLIIADRCHQDLADFSDRLFSSYAIENLEAALREVVDRWKASYPGSTFSYTSTGGLEENEPINYQFLLIWLDELCHSIVKSAQPVELKLTSQQENRKMYLDCSIQAQSTALVFPDDIQYFKPIFTILQKGRCQITVQNNQCQIQLQW